MERKEAIDTLRKYNKTLNINKLPPLQKELVELVNTKDYFNFTCESVSDFGEDVEEFLKENLYFEPLLKEHHEKLCIYLRNLHLYTCNTYTIRMDIRSSHFNDYRSKIITAISSFYYFYALDLDIKDAVYGTYRSFPIRIDFAPIITSELLNQNEQVVSYCKEVLTSENNTAVLTQAVLRAIEMSPIKELHDLMINLFLAAKLQEGLRQSVVESVDEGQIDLFYRIIDVIHDENLIRFSSVQRGILTWIGLGYEIVEERQMRHIFHTIYNLSHQYSIEEVFNSEDPIQVYLGLYFIGLGDLDAAVNKAIELLTSSKRYIVACALIYLKLTLHFDEVKYVHQIKPLLDDEWIMALFVSECCARDYSKKPISSKSANILFDVLLEATKRMKAQQTISSQGFDWFHVQLSKGRVATVMFDLMKCGITSSQIEKYLPLVSQLSDYKIKDFMDRYFVQVNSKAFLFKEIIASSEVLSEACMTHLMKLPLTQKDIIDLETRLKSKKAHARANIIKVISKQNKEIVLESYERMKTSNIKTIQESAIELTRFASQYFKEEKKIEVKGTEEGFGLYTPYQYEPIEYTSFLKTTKKRLLKKKEIVDTSFLYVYSKEEVLNYLHLWSCRIQKHATDEYEVRGSIHQVGENYLHVLDWKDKTLKALPLEDTWRHYLNEDHLSDDVLFQFMFLFNSVGVNYSAILPHDFDFFTISSDDIKACSYYHHIVHIITRYAYERDIDKVSKVCQYLEVMNKYTTYRQYQQKNYVGEFIYSVSHLNGFSWMVSQLDLVNLKDDLFKKVFPIVYETYQKFNLMCDHTTLYKFNIQLLALCRAYRMNLISKEVLIEMILDIHAPKHKNVYVTSHRLFEGYRDAYYHGRGIYGKPDFEKQGENQEVLKAVLNDISYVLLKMETTRLNERTPVTTYIPSLKVILGMDALVIALNMLKGEELRRQTDSTERISVFMEVIKNSYPIPTDDINQLKNQNIEEKRLVEVAMLAPQWMDFIQEVLGWDGFKEACYYFIAHMKQYDMQHKKAEISKYTDLEPEDLNDGAFDMRWCLNVYEKLGQKRFKMLYDASKFLCDNSFHTRARKYADATLGLTKKEEFLNQAKAKRNKDALNAYCICPLENKKDLLERYLYIQTFLKESKTFGAQRQASEKRACEIALMNLAKNSSYETVTRLTWVMESEMISQYQSYLKMQPVEDIEIGIEIDELGTNEIVVYKKGKAQKTIPSKLKNHPYILEIKEAHNELTKQYRRAKDMLQKAMEERIVLTLEEVEAMTKNPVVFAILSKLVLRNNNHLGFYKDGFLQAKDGNYEVAGEIYIAHAYDMYVKDEWSYYQQYIFDHQLVQPFKQVFRELYLKLDDERNMTYTKRYTGYQIQPQKVAATLKSRHWNASYENGLERVYHNHNVVVNLLCDADWFSPSDIEAPSLDYVTFSHIKKQEQPLTIGEIDDVLFSEIMRDLDLAVSVAYVGGVDPLTSFSTIELRKAIVEYTSQLMKLDNVSVQDHFVNIKGSLNTYHVHLGSGMIHQDGGASIHMIPVYSGKRGKVYLPFLDEDPMSAQILTKIIILSEDQKIKDPSILNQIVTQK